MTEEKIMDEDEKKKALAKFLGCEPEDIEKLDYDHYGLPVYRYKDKEYAVGTDEEANKAVKECIKNSIWAFRAEFIVEYCNLPMEFAEVIKGYQEAKCESANDALLALVESHGGLDSFVEKAVEIDGRGHFLNDYDGAEYEVKVNGKTYYIYIL